MNLKKRVLRIKNIHFLKLFCSSSNFLKNLDPHFSVSDLYSGPLNMLSTLATNALHQQMSKEIWRFGYLRNEQGKKTPPTKYRFEARLLTDYKLWDKHLNKANIISNSPPLQWHSHEQRNSSMATQPAFTLKHQ
jgi:hypothetical protein